MLDCISVTESSIPMQPCGLSSHTVNQLSQGWTTRFRLKLSGTLWLDTHNRITFLPPNPYRQSTQDARLQENEMKVRPENDMTDITTCKWPFQFQMISTHLEKAYRCSTPFQFQMISTHSGESLQVLHPIPVPGIYTHGESLTAAPPHYRQVPPELHNFQTVAMMVWLMIMAFNVHSRKECQAFPLSTPSLPGDWWHVCR